MVDKPSKSPDLYHSCYSLAGYSIMQWGLNNTKLNVIGG